MFYFRYKVVLNSDQKTFDGHGRINDEQMFFTDNIMWDDRQFSFRVNSTKYFYQENLFIFI